VEPRYLHQKEGPNLKALYLSFQAIKMAAVNKPKKIRYTNKIFEIQLLLLWIYGKTICTYSTDYQKRATSTLVNNKNFVNLLIKSWNEFSSYFWKLILYLQVVSPVTCQSRDTFKGVFTRRLPRVEETV
jgi:hypothetical protein